MWTNMYTVGVPEGEDKDKGAEGIFEGIIAEDLPNLLQYMNMNIQEAQ